MLRGTHDRRNCVPHVSCKVSGILNTVHVPKAGRHARVPAGALWHGSAGIHSNTISSLLGYRDLSNTCPHNPKFCQTRKYLQVVGYQGHGQQTQIASAVVYACACIRIQQARTLRTAGAPPWACTQTNPAWPEMGQERRPPQSSNLLCKFCKEAKSMHKKARACIRPGRAGKKKI